MGWKSRRRKEVCFMSASDPDVAISRVSWEVWARKRAIAMHAEHHSLTSTMLGLKSSSLLAPSRRIVSRISDSKMPTACSTPCTPATLWANKKPLPTPTASAPKHSALTTSVPLWMPPSIKMLKGRVCLESLLVGSRGVSRSG